MDMQNYLKQQLKFIRQFYDMSSAPFIERKRLIEDGEEPFAPKYCGEEDPEPYFLYELIEADESLQILGCVCVSMLSNVFKIYFKEWEVHRIRIPMDAPFNKGFLNGYKGYFAKNCGVQFENSPANLNVLQEIILVRNTVQHLESITVTTPSYSVNDLEKLRSPFFMDDYKSALFSEADEGDNESLEFLAFCEGTSVQVTGEKFYAAISEMEKFTEWLEDLWKKRNQ